MESKGSLSKVVLSFIFRLMLCSPCPTHQKQSLLRFKSSFVDAYNTSDPSLLDLGSWDSTSDSCAWNRVVCGSYSRSIVALNLSNIYTPLQHYNINPNILDPIYSITSLSLLNISYNFIVGEISGKGLANLTKLVHLDMSLNDFNGTIPAQVFQLKNLQFLDLSYNSLKGGLSSVVGKLGNLRTRKLEENVLDGYVPVQIGNLTKSQHFSINHNKLLGRIPDSIGYLKGLERLYMSENSFSGLIPPSISNLIRLETLLLENNRLSGEIPSSLFDIESLKILNLGGNTLTWNNNVKIVPKYDM
ncbi:receptor-like protein 46 [Daucus carota subsp. sativus]|uniref:receptor-like protein 46 n=1 Tax=Daucus carota subsp. sativus TaxID=79200 RepID=UPI003083E685